MMEDFETRHEHVYQAGGDHATLKTLYGQWRATSTNRSEPAAIRAYPFFDKEAHFHRWLFAFPKTGPQKKLRTKSETLQDFACRTNRIQVTA
jgi:hypothetical protein